MAMNMNMNWVICNYVNNKIKDEDKDEDEDEDIRPRGKRNENTATKMILRQQ